MFLNFYFRLKRKPQKLCIRAWGKFILRARECNHLTDSTRASNQNSAMVSQTFPNRVRLDSTGCNYAIWAVSSSERSWRLVKCWVQTSNISMHCRVPPSVPEQENSHMRQIYSTDNTLTRPSPLPNYPPPADARFPLPSFIFFTCLLSASHYIRWCFLEGIIPTHTHTHLPLSFCCLS